MFPVTASFLFGFWPALGPPEFRPPRPLRGDKQVLISYLALLFPTIPARPLPEWPAWPGGRVRVVGLPAGLRQQGALSGRSRWPSGCPGPSPRPAESIVGAPAPLPPHARVPCLSAVPGSPPAGTPGSTTRGDGLGPVSVPPQPHTVDIPQPHHLITSDVIPRGIP